MQTHELLALHALVFEATRHGGPDQDIMMGLLHVISDDIHARTRPDRPRDLRVTQLEHDIVIKALELYVENSRDTYTTQWVERVDALRERLDAQRAALDWNTPPDTGVTSAE